MRVTGAADPTVSVKETLKGKLPQKKLVRSAAHGYSSYGNQIGLATGYVKEIYHPDYVAKRMEIGAVMGAAPRRAVIRENSDPGDIIILSLIHICYLHVTVPHIAGPKFYGWLAMMGKDVHILKPKKTAASYRDYLKTLAKEYKGV